MWIIFLRFQNCCSVWMMIDDRAFRVVAEAKRKEGGVWRGDRKETKGVLFYFILKRT